MNKVNLRNMPYGVLYEFAPGSYVWRISRPGGTRAGNYLRGMDSYSEYTEVFRLIQNGRRLSCDWSGSLSENPGLYNEDGLDERGCFYIFSYDQDCGATFKQTHDLIKASPELQIQALKDEKRVIASIQSRIEEERRRRY